MGVLNGARIGHPYLAKTPGSCLLNTASASAIYGSAGLALYSATKFAVRALTEALDGEWAAHGIRVRASAELHRDAVARRRAPAAPTARSARR